MRGSSSMRSLFLVLPCLLGQASAIYNPLIEYAGSTFFDKFSYYGNVDNTTWGNATFLDQPSAVAQKLTFINDAGNAVVKVDNTTTLVAGPPGQIVNRNSVRLTSLDSFGLGTLIMIDVAHIPFGCSVWPAFWTFGMEDTWPAAGEIDIIEAINGMNNSQMALHTTPGCTQVKSPIQSGTIKSSDCAPARGCVVSETKANSYGAGFASAGGGVFAVQMEAAGINFWFWSRPDVPAEISGATSTTPMDVSTWGIPSGAYPAGDHCDITQFFPPQNIVLLTTLCGHWAGVPSIYATTCSGDCFADNVLGDGSNYADAYWEVRSIRTYFSSDATPAGSAVTAPAKVETSTTSSDPTAASTPVIATGGTVAPVETIAPTSAAARGSWAPVSSVLALVGSFVVAALL